MSDTPLKFYIPIAGTWARHEFRRSAWYSNGSAFDRVLTRCGYTRVRQNRAVPSMPDTGFWTGDVGGLLIQQILPHLDYSEDWEEGGHALARFVVDRHQELYGAESVTLIAHSHGGQVVSYALEELYLAPPKCPILEKFRVITVDMPVRKGRFRGLPRAMSETYENASKAVKKRWLHLYSESFWKNPWATRYRWLGSRFGPRKFDGAGENKEIKGGHSGILSIRQLGEWPDILKSVENL